MGQVRTFIVTEKRNFTLGLGDSIYECAPGTVLYEPWLEDAAGMSTYRLEHLGLIAASGVADEEAVPETPGQLVAEIDGVFHVGPIAPEASAGGGAGDGSATGDDSPESEDLSALDGLSAEELASLSELTAKPVGPDGEPLTVPDGGDASTAEPQELALTDEQRAALPPIGDGTEEHEVSGTGEPTTAVEVPADGKTVILDTTVPPAAPTEPPATDPVNG